MIATGSERYQNTPTTNKRFPEHIGGSKYADADHCYLLPFLFISSSRMLFLSPHFIVRIINGPYIRSFLYYPLRLCLFSLLILFLFFFCYFALFLFTPPAANNWHLKHTVAQSLGYRHKRMHEQILSALSKYTVASRSWQHSLIVCLIFSFIQLKPVPKVKFIARKKDGWTAANYFDHG